MEARMLRFTVRELLLVTLSVGLGLGWWIDHRANAKAAEDARMLALFSVQKSFCGTEAIWYMELQDKYGAKEYREAMKIE
jgi:hypothetical protein